MNEEQRTRARTVARRLSRQAGQSDDVLEVCNAVIDLLHALTSAEERILDMEQHPPGCECRECRIP